MPKKRNAAKNVRALLTVCALTVAICVAGPAVASAHAYVVAATPAMNARVNEPPPLVAISFDEPVDVFDANAVQVFDGSNRRVDLHDARIDPEDATRVVAHLRGGLVGGDYTVRWRVISADTHIVHGQYSIAVGPGAHVALPSAADTSPFDPSMPLASVLRWFALMGAIIATGAVVLCLVALRRLEDLRIAFDVPAHRATVIGCAFVLGAALPSLLLQTLAASAGAFSFGAAGTTALHSLWGHALIVRIVAAAGVLVTIHRRNADWPLSAAPLVALLLMTFTVTGHATSTAGLGWRILAETNDFTHLVAVGAWIGGMLVMAASLRGVLNAAGPDERGTIVRRLFAAFTPLAIACACVAVATGTVAGFWRIPAASDLVSTAYGITLSLKVALVAVLLVFGYRQFRTGLGRSDPRAIGALRGEAIVALAIVACSAILVGQAPPERPARMAPNMPMSMKVGP